MATLAGIMPGGPAQAQGSEPYLGEIVTMPYSFCPRNWIETQGQLLPIAQYTALFSLLGTQYGGNGSTTFGIPDLRGRVAIMTGQGDGLNPRALGEQSGTESASLSTAAMNASHTHAAFIQTTNLPADTNQPRTNAFGLAAKPTYKNGTMPALNPMNVSSLLVQSSGTGAPHPNMQPYLVLRSCLATSGVFPARS